MEQNRTTLAVSGIVLILGLWFIYFLNFLSGDMQAAFYGMLVGIALGIATCFRMAKTWDPVNLRPVDPNTKRAGGWIFWTVPIGIILARILPRLVGEEITDLLAGCGLMWGTLLFGYMSIQVWRHRPR